MGRGTDSHGKCRRSPKQKFLYALAGWLGDLSLVSEEFLGLLLSNPRRPSDFPEYRPRNSSALFFPLTRAVSRISSCNLAILACSLKLNELRWLLFGIAREVSLFPSLSFPSLLFYFFISKLTKHKDRYCGHSTIEYTRKTWCETAMRCTAYNVYRQVTT